MPLRHVLGSVVGCTTFSGRTRASALVDVRTLVGSQVTGSGKATVGPEPVALDAQIESIRTMLAAGQRPPAGQLLGLPELDGDLWADIAGAAAITGAPPRTIAGWLNRRGPKRCPFPEPRRSLYRLYWPVSALQAWRDDYAAAVGSGAAERVPA